MSKSKKRNIPAPPKPNMVKKPKLSHNSIYYKQEFAIMYAPVPMRTAITFRLFWWNKISINVQALYLTLKTKLTKAKPENKKGMTKIVKDVNKGMLGESDGN